jgi:hypothetical protein
MPLGQGADDAEGPVRAGRIVTSMFLSASLGLGGGSCCTFVGAKAGRLIDERSAPGRPVLPCDAIDVDVGRTVLVRTREQGNVKGVYLGCDCSPSPSLTLLIPGPESKGPIV